jgi:hypothetical protein
MDYIRNVDLTKTKFEIKIADLGFAKQISSSSNGIEDEFT